VTAAASQDKRLAGTVEYLVVDEYLRTMVDARALKTAFEVRFIDLLEEHGALSEAAALKALKMDEQGLRFLVALLEANGVIERRRGQIFLQEGFCVALKYRDLLETKLDFAGALINDFADSFTALLMDPASFMGQSRLFQLFDYRRCFEPTLENYQRTRAWMRLTSTLTRYEAAACLELHDFGAHRRMLDVGGNSGEFVLQACRRQPALRGTVVDLPLVCEIGLEHVLGEEEHSRIAFIKADLRAEPLPAGYDLVSFKSMLHDWPEQQALAFLTQAVRAAEPGGTVLIFERGPIAPKGVTPPFSMLPILLFFRSYRQPSVYAMHLESLGCTDVRRQDIRLDTPFHLVTARTPAAGRAG